MINAIRAVYENGHLRLLQPINLVEGQEIQIVVLTEREQAIIALGNLVVSLPEIHDVDIDEEALFEEIDAVYRGKPPVSEAIIEERHEGP
jgi:predicted DNA-binding antitoxin AbrB/MazE fold protein